MRAIELERQAVMSVEVNYRRITVYAAELRFHSLRQSRRCRDSRPWTLSFVCHLLQSNLPPDEVRVLHLPTVEVYPPSSVGLSVLMGFYLPISLRTGGRHGYGFCHESQSVIVTLSCLYILESQ